ncbi:glucosylceramidase [Segetibacter sp. 3557_3]|uniref:glycoside hydrolase family 30 protein n=1 Tax=Segetibacter sp. 3557_3 TaxID=2547429 RepID=UPI001058B519|nr:glycoside hydrolase family 30 beta sandwich domain-containing protein [Segetibacter sp. 3557_3]TDH26957.1 glucosylceramidase [Segetibacter sp. 3557_3]
MKYTSSISLFKSAILVFTIGCFLSCSKKSSSQGGGPGPVTPPVAVSNDMEFWLTKADQSALLAKQAVVLGFINLSNQNSTITVDTTQLFQSIDGFGYTLTGGSAQVINAALSTAQREALLKELFTTEGNGIGISYLRISIGASDLNQSVFTYDDVPAGQTDVNLEKFSLAPDKGDLIPLLKQIVAINPAIKIVATPWTAPVWMKTNNSSIGGKLKPEYYGVYANYFVKYLQAMKAEGIPIDAITPQNEPLHPGNNPSLEMSATEQATFIKNNLGPAFKAANLNTKIIIYDHNADRPDYPLAVLSDPAARQYIDGSAFHLYAGNISALSQVHTAFPDKHIYFTEQYTASTGNFGGDLSWHINNLVVGATRNWSRNVLEWNLANDPNYGPHTNGGCTTCKGALTIGSSITRNVAYYIIAHASKWVPAGSYRVESNMPNNLPNVAFVTPSGKKVLIVLNTFNTFQSFNIKFKEKAVVTGLEGGAVGTFVW